MLFTKGLTSSLRALFVVVALLGVTALAVAQTPNGQPNAGVPSADALSGTYKGAAKGDPAGDIAVTIELQNQSGNLTGQLTVHETTTKLAEGTFKDGHLTLKFKREGNEIDITGELKGDTIAGTWTLDKKTGPIELKKVPAAATTSATPATAAVNGDVFTGDWDAVADANGQSFPFTLTLKVDGEKVTGGSSSELGTSTIGTGAYKEGRVTFRLDGTAGAIAMTATIQDGKLVGDFDYAGQMQGRWVAVKHKP